MVYYRQKGENIMFVEILASDKKSLNKLILSAIENQDAIIKKMRFILEVIPNKGVYIIADSVETDKIPIRDLNLMLTACGTELLKRKDVRGSVQVYNRQRFVDEF
jgi:hypothetical protein